MTTVNEARYAIIDYFFTEWASLTPIAFENQSTDLSDGNASWVRLSIVPTVQAGATIGERRRYEMSGRVNVETFSNENSTEETSDLLNRVLEIFQGARITGVRIYDGDFGQSFADGKWWKSSVSFIYQFDARR